MKPATIDPPRTHVAHAPVAKALAARAASGRGMLVASVVLAAAGAIFAASCEDPVADDRIAALGPENPSIHRGPLHRAGQPCLVCHGGYGPGRELAFAGTIYATPTDKTPVNAAKITVTDATGQTREIYSNCAGNFLEEINKWTPVFPLRAEIECTLPLPDGSPAGTVPVKRRSVMQTRIDRDGSCAGCHTGDPSQSSPGRIGCDIAQPDPPYTQLAGCYAGGG